jgi:peptidoglycan/LPS O-acetylase OafA/YrhL
MVLDFGVSNLPMEVFMAVHVAAFLTGIYLAWRATNYRAPRALATGFALFSVAELLYMGYHLSITTFLLSHTLAEALDLAAFILVLVGYAQHTQVNHKSGKPAP